MTDNLKKTNESDDTSASETAGTKTASPAKQTETPEPKGSKVEISEDMSYEDTIAIINKLPKVHRTKYLNDRIGNVKEDAKKEIDELNSKLAKIETDSKTIKESQTKYANTLINEMWVKRGLNPKTLDAVRSQIEHGFDEKGNFKENIDDIVNKFGIQKDINQTPKGEAKTDDHTKSNVDTSSFAKRAYAHAMGIDLDKK